MKILKTSRKVRCMNHEPQDSKYGDWAPRGGCDEWVEIDGQSVKGLCWRCTNRAANNDRTFSYED